MESLLDFEPPDQPPSPEDDPELVQPDENRNSIELESEEESPKESLPAKALPVQKSPMRIEPKPKKVISEITGDAIEAIPGAHNKEIHDGF